MIAGTSTIIAACVLRTVFAGVVTSYDAGIYTETRGRFRPPSETSDLEVGPRVSLLTSAASLDTTTSYSPRLFVQDWHDEVNVLHRASWDLSWRLDPAWSVTAAANGSYGTSDLLLTPTSAPAGATAAQPLPQLTHLPYAAGYASIGVTGQFAPRYRADFRVAAFTDGGRGAAAERDLPRELGARAAAGLSYEVSRTDRFGGEVRTSFTGLSQGRNDGAVALLGTWRHMLRRRAPLPESAPAAGVLGQEARELQVRGEIWVAAGSAATLSYFPGQTTWSGTGTAEVGARMPLAGRAVDWTVLARLSPQVDRFTAALNNRAEAEARVAWRVERSLALSATGNGGVAVSGVGAGQRVATAELAASWAMLSTVDATVAGRGWWQHEVQNTIPSFHELGFFVRLTYHVSSRVIGDAP